MKALISFLLLIALAASALALYFRSTAVQEESARNRAESEVRQLKIELTAADIRVDRGAANRSSDGAPEEVLRARIVDMEQALDEKDEALGRLRHQLDKAEVVPEPIEAPRTEPDRRGWQQRMEDLRTEDPREYARVQEERRQFVQRMNEHVGGQVEFFSSLNTDGLPEEYGNNHAALVERLAAFQERIRRVAAESAASDEGISRRELFRDFREIVPMLDMERQVVLNDLALDMGYTPDEAQSFVEHLDYIDEMTSPRAIMRGIWGGRERRGGP